MLTHGLLPEEKLEKVRREVGVAAAATAASPKPAVKPDSDDPSEVAALRRRVAELEAEVAELQSRRGEAG
jgi:multidrug resistance efflux pump